MWPFKSKKEKIKKIDYITLVKEYVKKYDDFYTSPKRLRRLVQKNQEKCKYYKHSKHYNDFGWFLVFGGGNNGNSTKEKITKKQKIFVQVAWEIKKDEYKISKFSIQKIHIKIEKDLKEPYITFNLRPYLQCPPLKEENKYLLEEWYKKFSYISPDTDQGFKLFKFGFFHDNRDIEYNFNKMFSSLIIHCNENQWPSYISLEDVGKE